MLDAMKAAVATSVKKKRMSQVGKGKPAVPVGPRKAGAALKDAGAAGETNKIRSAVIGKAARLARGPR